MKKWATFLGILLSVLLEGRLAHGGVTKLCVFPVDIKGGRGDEVRTFARDALRGIFEKYDFQWVSLSSTVLGLVREEDMLKAGKESNCDLVMAAALEIKSKHGWHITGPRAKAEATISTSIVDPKQGSVVYSVMNKTVDSKQRNLGQAIVAVFVSLGGAFLMGGSRSAHEKRAIANVIATVYEPFLTTRGHVIEESTATTARGATSGNWLDFLSPDEGTEISGIFKIELEVIGDLTELKVMVDGKEVGSTTKPRIPGKSTVAPTRTATTPWHVLRSSRTAP
ncbi:MAG: hypothetical protein V2G43_06945 [bacterium JZ-2024 1]